MLTSRPLKKQQGEWLGVKKLTQDPGTLWIFMGFNDLMATLQ
jgi:hypothetical protein